MRPFMSKRFYEILYKRGNLLEKLFWFFVAVMRRLGDIFIALRYDVIFIHLEAFPFGPPFIEYFWAFMRKPIIYDLDDAIYMRGKVSPSGPLSFLKCSFKISHIIRLSSHVIACNRYLKDYAAQFTAREKIDVIHTTVDTDKFAPRPKAADGRLVLGWIGSSTTSGYIKQIEAVLGQLAQKHDFIFRVVGACRNIEIPGVEVENIEWSLENDTENFQSLDIGLYPLPENDWVKGKTGFKTIQYMAVGIPCVASNVGSNKGIVEDGKNGFLADNDREWVDKLSLLIQNPDILKRIGFAGRKTAEDKFSIEINAPRYIDIFKEVLS